MFAYPHFGRIEQVTPNPSILLGNDIFWTEKLDGSNAGIYLKDGEPMVRSRNQDVAQFSESVKQIPVFDKIVKLLRHLKDNYHTDYIVFCEFMQKGRSPTGLKYHECDSLVVFDMYNLTAERFETWNNVCLFCGTFDIPVVKLLGCCTCHTLDELYAFRDELIDFISNKVTVYVHNCSFEMIQTKPDTYKYGNHVVSVAQDKKKFTITTDDKNFVYDILGVKDDVYYIRLTGETVEPTKIRIVKTTGEEGVVGKIYKNPSPLIADNYLFVKEKQWIPKPLKVFKSDVNGIVLPSLPVEDVRACVYKVKAEITPDEFRNSKVAMPLIAKAVTTECKQQNCKNTCNLFDLYREVLKNE